MKILTIGFFGLCAAVTLSQITTASAVPIPHSFASNNRSFTCGGFECRKIGDQVIDGKEYSVFRNANGETLYAPKRNSFLRCNRNNPQKTFECSSITKPEPSI